MTNKNTIPFPKLLRATLLGLIFTLFTHAISDDNALFHGQADFLLTLHPNASQHNILRQLLAEHQLQPKFDTPLNRTLPVRIPGHLPIHVVRQRLESDIRIQHIEPDMLYRICTSPNDPLYRHQWGMHDQDGDPTDIEVEKAWSITEGKKNIILAIIDTGIEYVHPDLNANIWKNPGEIPDNKKDDDQNGYVDDLHGWDFAYDDSDPTDKNFHGTLCAGIIGAVKNNRMGVSGIMPSVQMMALKGLSDKGWGFTSDLIACIYYAVDNGAQVINASWGGGGKSQAMVDALKYAEAHNVIFVAAAGNASSDIDERPFYPASYKMDNIISVGSHTQNGTISHFSNFGHSSVDLFAPGSGIWTTSLNGGYTSESGTSMAAPFVTGCIGLLIAAYPEAQYSAYIEAALQSARPHDEYQYKNKTGGRLNCFQMLQERQKLFKTIDKSKSLRTLLTLLAHPDFKFETLTTEDQK